MKKYRGRCLIGRTADIFSTNIINCALMKEYGFYELTPAMCSLDYTMSRLGGGSEFVRKYTLASGGPYCDGGYKKIKS